MGPRSKLVVIAATVAYPVVVYLGFGRWQPLWLGLALAALLLLRAWSARDGVWLVAGLGAALLSLASQWGGSCGSRMRATRSITVGPRQRLAPNTASSTALTITG